MHGAKGGAKLLKRLKKILENLKAAHGVGCTGNTVASTATTAAATVVASDPMMASGGGGAAVGVASAVAVEGAATAWPLTAPPAKRAKLA